MIYEMACHRRLAGWFKSYMIDIFYNCFSHGEDYMGIDARIQVFGGWRTTQAQTSLRIRAVWSAPLLFAFWKVPYLISLQVKFQFSS